jgi:hypothetical protein
VDETINPPPQPRFRWGVDISQKNVLPIITIL